MNKRQLEAVERAKLKSILDNNPKLKEVIGTMIKNPKPELKDIVEPVIGEAISKAERRGILIGWGAYAIRAYENIKGMETVDEIKDYFKAEQKSMEEKLKLESNNQGE